MSLSRCWALSAALCLVAVIVLVAAPRPSTKDMAKQFRLWYSPTGQVVMLDYYYYDFNFYLHTAKPALVVSDWTNPKIPLHDNRSEEHTSELQSLMRISYAVFCLKKKKTKYKII